MKKNKRKKALWFICVLLLVLGLAGGSWLKAQYPARYRPIVERYARENGLDPLLMAAIIRTESGFDASACSSAGAMGLMQLMPATAQWMADKDRLEYSEELLLDAEYNILMGCRYYAYLSGRFTDRNEILAAWNAGEGNVRKWISQGLMTDIPYNETRRFIQKVNKTYELYQWLYQNH